MNAHTAADVAGVAWDRLTTGTYVPLTPTRKRFTGKWVGIVAAPFAVMGLLLAVNALPQDSQATEVAQYGVSLALLPLGVLFWLWVARTVFRGGKKGKHVASRGSAVVARKVQSHGWPSWRDAWGTRGMRPGGWGVATMRGYLRVYLGSMALLTVLTVLTGGAAAAGVVMVGLVGGFFALPCVAGIYWARVLTFDPMKANFLSVVYWFAIDMIPWTNGGKVRAYPRI